MPTFTFDETTPAPTPAAITDDVELLHSYPRFHHSSDFDVGSDDYLKGLVFVGATVIALAVFLLLVYTLFLFARCCCNCCKFSEDDVTKHHERCSPRAQRGVLVVWLVLTAAMMCCSYIGCLEFVEGAADMADQADSLGGIFSTLETQGDSLAASATSMNTTLSNIACVDDDFIADFNGYVSEFSSAVDDLASLWTGIDDKFYRARDMLEDDAPRFIEAGIAATCALVVVVCVFGILADLLSCCCPLSYVLFNFASLLGVLVCLFLAILVALELSMSVAISDFCYNGVDASFNNILDERLKLEGDNRELIEYYVSCTGVNPLFSAMNESITQLEGINATVTTALQYSICSAAADVRALGTESIDTLGTLDDLQETIGCTAINPVYQTLTYDLLCGNVVEGLYWLWTVQVTAAFMLYVGLFIISYTKEKTDLQRAAARGEKYDVDDDLRTI